MRINPFNFVGGKFESIATQNDVGSISDLIGSRLFSHEVFHRTKKQMLSDE